MTTSALEETWQVELRLHHYTPRSGIVVFWDDNEKQYITGMEKLQEAQLKFGIKRVDKKRDRFLCTVRNDDKGDLPRIVSIDEKMA